MEENFKPVQICDIKSRHSKTLYRSICVPSLVQTYSLCIEYMQNWFLSKFDKDTFKSIYVDGKNIYDDFRSLSRIELLKRQKPALTIIPSINWEFNDELLDAYPFGLSMYRQSGKFKESFFSAPETSSYLGIGMETTLMEFNFRIKLETRAQQLDMYRHMKSACRVGFTCGEDVDLDFHIPYTLVLQMARDNGFATAPRKSDNGNNTEEAIEKIPEFLRWLNMHSRIPFIYKHRTLNGKNEFFLRMRDMYVHIRPGNLSADDGERQGQMMNNFTIDFSAEVRFPSPSMYAYYSDNDHKLTAIYGAWYQPNGPMSTCYTFKGTTIPDENKYGWPLLLSTTYEEDDDKLYKPLEVDLSELIEGDVGKCITDCLSKGLSPAIFCDIIFYNGGEFLNGRIDWETMKFTSTNPIRANGTYIGIYIDNAYVSDAILKETGYENRLQKSDRVEQ